MLAGVSRRTGCASDSDASSLPDKPAAPRIRQAEAEPFRNPGPGHTPPRFTLFPCGFDPTGFIRTVRLSVFTFDCNPEIHHTTGHKQAVLLWFGPVIIQRFRHIKRIWIMGAVLIIDDEVAIGTYLAKLIERLGHHAVTADTAAGARAKLDSEAVNLIIADIRLPDAPEPHEWIRQLCEQAAGRPVVLISGAPSAELLECAKANGVMAFLSKPFELTFIKNILQTVFET
jgi:CheY-like chemotaxis protein